MDHFDFGNLLRELRLEHHYTQRRLAEELGISHRDIQAWEEGRAFPDDQMYERLSEVLHTSLEELKQGKAAIPDDLVGDKLELVLTKIGVYTTLLLTLVGISLYLFSFMVFVAHILFVIVGLIISRKVLFKRTPQKRLKQYLFITAVLTVLLVVLSVVAPNYYLIRQEEYLRLNSIYERIYYHELGPGVDVETFYGLQDTMYAAVYIDEQPDVDIIDLTHYFNNDVRTIDTGDEKVLDVIFYQDKLFMSTLTHEAETNEYRVYQVDRGNLAMTLVYESSTVYRLHATQIELFLITDPLYGWLDSTIYRVDEAWDTYKIRRVPYQIWDLEEYMINNQAYFLVSATGSKVVDNVQMFVTILVDTNTFATQGVLVEDLKDPLHFVGEHYDIYGYNEDAVYRFDEDTAEKIKNADGYYDVTFINEDLFYADFNFYDSDFDLVQKHEFYDDDMNRWPFPAEIVPDGNGNYYILDNEFIGFGVQMPNEYYIWMLPIEFRIAFAIIGVGLYGVTIQFGQYYYRKKQEYKSKIVNEKTS